MEEGRWLVSHSDEPNCETVRRVSSYVVRLLGSVVPGSLRWKARRNLWIRSRRDNGGLVQVGVCCMEPCWMAGLSAGCVEALRFVLVVCPLHPHRRCIAFVSRICIWLDLSDTVSCADQAIEGGMQRCLRRRTWWMNVPLTPMESVGFGSPPAMIWFRWWVMERNLICGVARPSSSSTGCFSIMLSLWIVRTILTTAGSVG